MDGHNMFARNLDFFAAKFPELHSRLIAITAPMAHPVIAEGAVTDIDLGTGCLYKTDAREVAAMQVAAFMDSPNRIGFTGMDVGGDSLITRNLYGELLNSVHRHGISQVRQAPVVRSGFAFVFGIGLGYHLPPLVAGLDVRHIIVVEAIDEFLLASLHAIDWVALDQSCEQNELTLHVICGDVPEDIAAQIMVIVNEVGPALLDGSYLYRHYPFWTLDEAHRRTLNEIPRNMITRGYYEDERKMIRNAVTNLTKFSSYLVEGQFRPPRNVPAFIIASGPSLDESIEYIKLWREHVVVFSGGSSLEACLKHGIIPDYHVELENVAAVWDMLQHILDRNPELFPDKRFHSIKLVASVTVNPRVPPLFDETYFFFRDSTVSTKCLAEGLKTMSAVGPNVANTMVSVAGRMGFPHMYLFGVDCGWRVGAEHHSKETAYYTSGRFRVEEMSGEYSCPGNFGGTIEADLILDWSRDMLEQKIRYFPLNVFNCSDGALIRGATPKLAEALSFTDPLPDRPRILEEIRKDSRYLEPGEFLKTHDFSRFIDMIRQYRTEMMEILDWAVENNPPFSEFHDRVWALLCTASDGEFGLVAPWFSPTIQGCVYLACFYMHRITDPDALEKVKAEYYAASRESHRQFFDEGEQIMTEAKIMVEGGPEPFWTDGLPQFPGTTY